MVIGTYLADRVGDHELVVGTVASVAAAGLVPDMAGAGYVLGAAAGLRARRAEPGCAEPDDRRPGAGHPETRAVPLRSAAGNDAVDRHHQVCSYVLLPAFAAIAGKPNASATHTCAHSAGSGVWPPRRSGDDRGGRTGHGGVAGEQWRPAGVLAEGLAGVGPGWRSTRWPAKPSKGQAERGC